MLAVKTGVPAKNRFGHVANMSLVGTFVDIFRAIPYRGVPALSGPRARRAWGIACGIFLILCGLAISALEAFCIWGAGFGAGPGTG